MKKKSLLLITRSSLSHDISNFLFLEANLSIKSQFSLVVVLSFSSKNRYILHEYRNYFSCSRVLDVNCVSILQRLFTLFVMNVLRTALRLELTYVQTTPGWMQQRFRFLSLALPKAPIFLVGDGVGNECLSQAPFWLQHKFRSASAIDNEVKHSFFCFDFLDKHEYTFPRSQYTPIHLKTVFFNVLDLSIKSKSYAYCFNILEKFIDSSQLSSINIFLSSTFCENDRMSLDAEMSLYNNSIKEIFFNSDSEHHSHSYLHLFKPHPSSSDAKINALVHLLGSHFPSRSSLYSRDFLKLLSSLPVELLIAYFDRLLCSKRSTIMINVYSSSAACIPATLAFKRVKSRVLYGSCLREKDFISFEHYSRRLIQEKLINNVLDAFSL